MRRAGASNGIGSKKPGRYHAVVLASGTVSVPKHRSLARPRRAVVNHPHAHATLESLGDHDD